MKMLLMTPRLCRRMNYLFEVNKVVLEKYQKTVRHDPM